MNEWISVKDRLPEIDGNVLVIVNGRPHKNVTLESAYELAEFSPAFGWIMEMWPEWETPDVTHWMPLPEPPEEANATTCTATNQPCSMCQPGPCGSRKEAHHGSN